MKNELKKCAVCGAEIASIAKACPSCGARQKHRIYKKYWLWAVMVLLIGSTGCVGGRAGSKSGSVAQRETQAQEPEQNTAMEFIGDITVESDMFGTTLSGVLKNNSGRDCSYLQISFNLYDADGNLTGTAFDNINNLSNGGTWKFKAIGFGSEDAVRWEIGEITGW